MMEDDSDSFYLSISRDEIKDTAKQVNFLQQAKEQLQNYADIDSNDFQIVQENEKGNTNALGGKSYLQFHSLVVPIGTNFQADIPQITSAKSYLYKNREAYERVKYLKMHDPEANMHFYEKYRGWFERNFGRNVTYEDVTIIKKHIELFKPNCTFEEYFSNESVYSFWNQHFQSKNTEISKRMAKKKKRKCGSMD